MNGGSGAAGFEGGARAAVRAVTLLTICVLVVTPHPQVARWASRPAATRRPGNAFLPMVMRPDGSPWVPGPAGLLTAGTHLAAGDTLNDPPRRAREMHLLRFGRGGGIMPSRRAALIVRCSGLTLSGAWITVPSSRSSLASGAASRAFAACASPSTTCSSTSLRACRSRRFCRTSQTSPATTYAPVWPLPQTVSAD